MKTGLPTKSETDNYFFHKIILFAQTALVTVTYLFMVELCEVYKTQLHQQNYLPDKYLGYCAAAPIPCLNKTILIASLYKPPTDSSYRLPISGVIELIKLLHPFITCHIFFNDML